MVRICGLVHFFDIIQQKTAERTWYTHSPQPYILSSVSSVIRGSSELSLSPSCLDYYVEDREHNNGNCSRTEESALGEMLDAREEV